MKAVVDLADREADEGDHHKKVTAKLIRNLEREIEQPSRQNIGADHKEHHDQGNGTGEPAHPLDNAFLEPVGSGPPWRSALFDRHHSYRRIIVRAPRAPSPAPRRFRDRATSPTRPSKASWLRSHAQSPPAWPW